LHIMEDKMKYGTKEYARAMVENSENKKPKMKKIKFEEWSKNCPWMTKDFCQHGSDRCSENICPVWHTLDGYKFDNAKK